MRERACRFGTSQRLVGVVTMPDAPPRRVALVLVTAGVTPKCGPFRLYAELARRMASEAVLTLRFDLGGIGDSRAEAAARPVQERTLDEIRAALDYLADAYEVDAFVLCGLCSGAEDSFRAAERDPRVAGVVMVDPFAYKTRRWAWWHLVFRSKRRLLRMIGVHRPAPRAAKEPLVAYKYMEAADSSRILGTMLERRARVHFVYTGGVPRFNHERQLSAMFPNLAFDGLVTLDHLPEVDHTQLLEGDRRKVVEAIARRLAWCRAPSPEVRESGVVCHGAAEAAAEPASAS